MIPAHCVQKLLNLALQRDEHLEDSSPRTTALFSLGKMASHQAIRTVLDEHNCEQRITPFLSSQVGSVRANARRLIDKLQEHRANITSLSMNGGAGSEQ
jgi:hypothetical protein